MSFYSNQNLAASSAHWDDATLSNAMMAVSLSEGHQLLQRRYSTDMTPQMQQQQQQQNGGWGSLASRQTCKNDLCSLSQRNAVAPAMNQTPAMPLQTGAYFSFDL